MRNTALRLRGRPDGVKTARGALYPVEIKSHARIQQLDVLELAFYWELLEPWRSRAVRPEGRLILRRDGEPQEVRVPIGPEHLEEMRALVARVRHARQHRPQARFCRCTVCRLLVSGERYEALFTRKDLSVICGVARYAALEAAGISDWVELLRADPDHVAAVLKAEGYRVSADYHVALWRLHATSYQTGAPALVERPAPLNLGRGYVVVDLEYDPSCVWLIGLCRARDQRVEHLQLWAELNAKLRASCMLRRHLARTATLRRAAFVACSGSCSREPSGRRRRYALMTLLGGLGGRFRPERAAGLSGPPERLLE